MNLQEEVDCLRNLKVERCRENKGPADVLPMIKAVIGEVVVAIPVIGDNEPRINVRDALGGLLGFMKTLPKPSMKWDSISFCTEAYMRKTPDLENYNRGELQEEFQNDPESDVGQCIILTVINWDGSDSMAIIEYGYDDYGMPEFTESVFNEGTMGGEIVKVLKSFAMFCRFHEDKTEV